MHSDKIFRVYYRHPNSTSWERVPGVRTAVTAHLALVDHLTEIGAYERHALAVAHRWLLVHDDAAVEFSLVPNTGFEIEVAA